MFSKGLFLLSIFVPMSWVLWVFAFWEVTTEIGMKGWIGVLTIFWARRELRVWMQVCAGMLVLGIVGIFNFIVVCVWCGVVRSLDNPGNPRFLQVFLNSKKTFNH